MKAQKQIPPQRAAQPRAPKTGGPLQRAADDSAASQSLTELQLMADARPTVQRAEDDEFQAKFIQRAEAPAPKANNTGLPDNLKSGIENLSGMSMDHVRVHRNSDKPAAVQAHAYAQGSNIHLGPGQEQHLPHEAWHVVQQAQGRVKPTMQMKGVAVNDDAGLEHEADVMGAKAAQLGSTKEIVASSVHRTTNTATCSGDGSLNSSVQRVAGHNGLDEFKAAIHEGSGKAEAIATSLYAFNGSGDGDYAIDTKTKIRQAALDFGYPAEHAQRLSDKNPYQDTDIATNTTLNGGVQGSAPNRKANAESFEFSATIQTNDSDTVSRHQLNFDNDYQEDGEASMNYNARNPALANFYASNVVEVQRGVVGAAFGGSSGGGLVAVTQVTRSDVQSVNGREWWDRLPATGGTKFRKLTDLELQDFLKNTDNGKSTVSAFRGQYDVVTGETVVYSASDLDKFSVKLGLTPV
ncbi:DUF4157 domain-containing protein [Yoonia sp. I 8.24]|uniref:eCIS core domain-containing protein n=1 Tax=Yoonia sp. I 8.24 TaxID=1537229 RepID=UPI001EDDD790|nr:DUF4157 domain-containing protein [Yoonia sp. I 8.24]MCG3267850.1 DUF4157 domain-containing protein [Yoonia sp. I 8.24]